MNAKAVRAQPTRGQIAAAKLLVKREREGKSTIEIPDWIRKLAAIERELAEPPQRRTSPNK